MERDSGPAAVGKCKGRRIATDAAIAMLIIHNDVGRLPALMLLLGAGP